MNVLKVNPTRIELQILKEKLLFAKKGHKLLKDKRDGLVKKFMEIYYEFKNLRRIVDNKVLDARKKIETVKANLGEIIVESALMFSNQEINVEVKTENILGVKIMKYIPNVKIKDKNAVCSFYGPIFTSLDFDESVLMFNSLYQEMIRLAAFENSIRLMSKEIEKTRRRVNALEHVVIPETLENIKFISMKLDENERSTQVRLIKIKDMIIKKFYNRKKI
ncbi:MAG: V-type ATP synthase subunit D [Oscillospiraceae bacterium]|jgi:V/A-type H+-transporting ATPase subunit D|nr:V-type ATP synthase subunit D [Oscillospiraceae bacterium]